MKFLSFINFRELLKTSLKYMRL